MRHSRLRRLLIYALCCDFGLIAKRLISPAANLVTDALRIPGGIGAAFSLMFLIIAAMLACRPGCCTLMATVQGLLALAIGRVGSMGLLSPLGYILPGIVMDAALWISCRLKLSETETAVTTNICGSVCAALTANIIVFRLHGAPLALYLSVAALSGALFGLVAARALHLLKKALGPNL